MSKITERDIIAIQEENIKDYYEEIIIRRSIPDCRDGLKVIQRRILHIMNKGKITSKSKHVKSAKIVGNTLGVHPHGDASVYQALVGLTENWSNNQTLIDPHGNFGSVYGDDAASMRYTEARLHSFTEDILFDNINDNAVNFVPTFDNTEIEPSVLPSKLPMILINGAFGIGGGYMVSIPPHNINNVIDKTIELINNPNINIDEFIEGFHPDLPTGCVICNMNEVKKAYRTGTGKMVLRSKIEKDENKNQLIITSIPYMKNLNAIKESIINAVNDKKINGIKNMKNLSRQGNIKLIVELKKDADLTLVENQLYKFTHCQTTLPIKLLGTKDDKFVVYNSIKEIFQDWISFRIDTIKRIKMEHIRKHRLRIHILDGLLTALDPKNVDKVITIIRNGNSRNEIKEELISLFDFSEVQVDYILDLKLYRLNRLQVNDLLNEKQNLEDKVEKEIEYFSVKRKIEELIIEELKSLSKKYGKEKVSEALDIDFTNINNVENTIPDEDFLLIFTKNNYLKKIESNIKNQRRGGKGLNIGKIKNGDIPKTVINVNSKDTLLFFTNTGKVYGYKCYEFATNTLKTFGTNLSSYVNNENIVNILSITNDDIKNENIYLLIATKLNKIKLTALKEFKNLNKSGLIACKLNEGDEVITVEKEDMSKEFSVFALNTKGNGINIHKDDIPKALRPTFGANIFDSSEIKDGVEISTVITLSDEDESIFFITEDGLGKKVVTTEFPIQKRSGKGRIAIRLKGEDRAIKCLPLLSEEENIIVMTNTNIINISSSEIPKSLRPAYGSCIKKINEDEYIIDSCII